MSPTSETICPLPKHRVATDSSAAASPSSPRRCLSLSTSSASVCRYHLCLSLSISSASVCRSHLSQPVDRICLSLSISSASVCRPHPCDFFPLDRSCSHHSIAPPSRPSPLFFLTVPCHTPPDSFILIIYGHHIKRLAVITSPSLASSHVYLAFPPLLPL